ncbi:MAG: hypothetical protein KDE26_30435, partial [Bacteroidetes bacterium]|nr:hypothetical protein [Bacteroidota bacterium]
KGTQIAAKQTPEGYTVEMAIPVDYLNKTYGSDWQEIRLDIFANDNDYQGKHISQIFWKPDWRSDENIMGSGMFRRE